MTHLVKTPESSSVSSVICPITASTRSHSSWPQLILFWLSGWLVKIWLFKIWAFTWSQSSWPHQILSEWLVNILSYGSTIDAQATCWRVVILLSVHFLLKLWFKRKVGSRGRGEGCQSWDKAPTVLFLNWCVTDWPMWKIRACQVKVCNQPNKLFIIHITLIN